MPSPGLSVAPLLRPQEGQEAKGGGREGGASVDGVPQVQSGATPCPCSFSSLCTTCLPSLLPFRRQERRAEVSGAACGPSSCFGSGPAASL